MLKIEAVCCHLQSFKTYKHMLISPYNLPHSLQMKAHLFHYFKDEKIKKRKAHTKEKQNDSDVLVYTRYGNTRKLSKLRSEKSCYQATVKRVL